MTDFVYPALTGSGSTTDPNKLGISADDPATVKYNSKTYDIVDLPSFTVTGPSDVLTVTMNVTSGSGQISQNEDGPWLDNLVISGTKEQLEEELINVYMNVANTETGPVKYTVEIEDNDGNKESAGELQVVNEALSVPGKQAEATITVSGTSGAIRLLVNGNPIMPVANFVSTLDITIQAMVTAINGFTGTPKFEATKISGTQLKIKAPVDFGSDLNGTSVTAEVSGTMSIGQGGKLDGGVKGSLFDSALDKVKDAIIPGIGSALVGLALRGMSKAQVEVTVNSTDDDPDVSMLYDLKEISVPLGYVPCHLSDDNLWTAGTIPATWDYLTFEPTKVWCSNPALCLLELARTKAGGAADSIDQSDEAMVLLAKSLWAAVPRCDQFVRSGKKDAGGADIMEPRYSLDTMINGMTRKEAIEAVASNFHAMVVYADDGSIYVSPNLPGKAKRLVSEKNAGAGKFMRTGGSSRAKYNWVDTKYNDPDNMDQLNSAYDIDFESLQNGEKRFTSYVFGIRSPGRAKRNSRFIRLMEQSNPLMYSYKASWDHHDLQYGDLIAIISNVNKPTGAVYAGGRITKYISSTQVVVDRALTTAAGAFLHVTTQDGTPVSIAVTNITTTAGVSTVTLATPLPNQPATAMYLYHGQDLGPVTYRIIAKTEVQTGVWEISAVKYDGTIFDEMDNI